MITKFKIIAIITSMFIGTISFAQLTQPGGGDGSAPTDGGIAGGGAPIGGGLVMLIGMGLVYASSKTFRLNQEDKI